MWEGRLPEGNETFRSLVSQASRIPAIGEDFYLVPNKGTDKFYAKLKANGISDEKIFTTVASAYTNLTSGSGDTLYVCPGSYAQTSALTWAKHYTNLIGLSAPVQVNTRARITSTTAALSPLITWSANGCVVKDVLFSQEGSHATTAAICGYVTGARNYFEGVTFRNLGALAVVDNSCRCLKLASSDGENYFKKCTIGADTVDGVTATNYVIEFANTNQGNQRQIFDECVILGNGSANSSFVLASALKCIDGAWVMFKRCLFSNPMAGDYDQMTQAFSLSTDCNGVIYFMDNLVYGAATFETSNSGVLIGRNAYAAATTDSGVALTF
jgi:hypothetical protein